MTKQTDQTRDALSKMIKGLRKCGGDEYTLGYLESFVETIIHEYVKDQSDLSMLRMRMLGVGIEHLIDAK